MASRIPETTQKLLRPETLLSAARQSEGCLIVPVRLRRAIKRFLREQEDVHMNSKVLRLSQSFNKIKDVNLMLTANTSKEKEVVEDPMNSEHSRRWKIKSAYGDIGLQYRDDETVAYVASRMPSVFSACQRVLSEVKRRLPDFSPAKVLDFGAGTGSAFWALREIWPNSLQKVNLVEPSQSMQRAGRSLIQGLKNLPLIHGYDSIQTLTRNINKSEREHDLVIASYVLGEIPSMEDRITIVRQLWSLTGDVLVLIEPGTPYGSKIITQMRSYMMWMEKRKWRKSKNNKENAACKDLMSVKGGAFVVAPCAHDGRCPLEKSGKYCHFVQRLQRTTSQRTYKHSKGKPALRGFEDEKFSFVAFRRGQRPREPWPLDGVEFETLKKHQAKRNPEDLEIDYEDLVKQYQAEDVSDEEVVSIDYDSDATEIDTIDNKEKEDDCESEREEEETGQANVGGGWGRILFSPVRRGKRVTLDVCRSNSRDGLDGSLERIVVTRAANPVLHHQARKSRWGDLWPF